MYATSGRRDNDTTTSPSRLDVMSNSTNKFQRPTKLTDSGSYQANSRPQGRASHATSAREVVSNESLDSAAGASPGVTSNRPLQTTEARYADSQSTAIPAPVSRDRQATTQHRNTSELDVGLDTQSRAHQVSPSSCVSVLTLVILTYPLPQPPADADNTRSVAAHTIYSPMALDISALKEAQAAKREGVSPWPHLIDELHAAEYATA